MQLYLVAGYELPYSSRACIDGLTLPMLYITLIELLHAAIQLPLAAAYYTSLRSSAAAAAASPVPSM